MTKTPRVILGVLVIGVAAVSFAGTAGSENPVSKDPVKELLTALVGRPAIIEIATLDDLGIMLKAPDGFRYVQADSSNVQALQRHFEVKQPPALLFLDRFGNLLHRDEAATGRRRLGANVSEFRKKRRDLITRLARHEREAKEARDRGKAVAEVQHVLAILAQEVRGYPQSVAAVERARVLEADRRRRLLEILAGEGIEPRSQLESDLKNLADISKGLAVGAAIDRERQRLRRGVVVAERRRRG